MELRQCILTKNDCYKKGVKIAPKGIMMHSTGADNPYLRRYLAPDDGLIGKNQYNNHWNMAGLNVCVHGFIGLDINGDVQVYQTLPWTHRGWHCGRSGNDTHISFEICEDNLKNRDYWLKTKNAAVELCAYLCKEFDFDPFGEDVILDHATGHDLGIASDHKDVRHWWSRYNYSLEDFKKEVFAAMYDDLIKDLVEKKAKEVVPTAVAEYLAANPIVAPYEKVYNTRDELPKWARDELKPLFDAGVVKGDGTSLKLTDTMIRMLVFMWRLAGYGGGK